MAAGFVRRSIGRKDRRIMPKVTDTRKQRAAALLATIVRGPAVDIGHYPATADEFFKAYGNWVRMIRSESVSQNFIAGEIMAKSRRDIVPTEADGSHVVTIENFGPIERAAFRFVPGRITVVYGSNGAGKSESQIAGDVLAGVLGARDKIKLREGAESGRISGFGREVKFTAKRSTITGELEVLIVEEGFSLARFVDPGFKTAESNDRQRLKDLASVLGIEVDHDAVCQLVAGLDAERFKVSESADPIDKKAEAITAIEKRERTIYNRIVSEKTTKAKDPAEYVASLKTDCDRVALESEKTALVLTAEADALEDTLPDALPDVETDPEVLSAALADAVNAKRDLQRRDESAADAERLAKLAEGVLTGGQGQSVADASAAVLAADVEVQESATLIHDMEAALERERVRLQGLKRRFDEANAAMEAAEARRDELEKARKDLAAKIVRPTAEEWTKAEAGIKSAEDAIQSGAKVREAVETRRKIKERRDEAIENTKEAESLRLAAKECVGLLIEPINSLHCGIEIDEAWRLIFTEHPLRDGGRCPVEELSDGERWTLVVRLLVGVVGGNDVEAFVAIPQSALEGLDALALKMLIDEVAKTRLMVFVAKATATELEDGQLVREGVVSKLVEHWRDLARSV
jgi:hypothetical protein